MNQNRQVPVKKEELIAFLVQMRALYPHDKRSSSHWKVNMNTAVPPLRLELYAPDEGFVIEEAHLAPTPVWYVPLEDFPDSSQV